MQFLEDEIRQITEWVWTSMLDSEALPIDHAETEINAPQTLTSTVKISGDWRGAVTVNCSQHLARQIAAKMFEVEEDNASFAETSDALGELANMVGGNIKALLPASNRLSMPTVTENANLQALLPNTTLISRVDFHCLGEPFSVQLFQNL